MFLNNLFHFNSRTKLKKRKSQTQLKLKNTQIIRNLERVSSRNTSANDIYFQQTRKISSSVQIYKAFFACAKTIRKIYL
jgi:hypothetical protein